MTTRIDLSEVFEVLEAKGCEMVLDAKFVDNSFSHEFGVEKVIGLEVDDISIKDADGKDISKMPLADFIADHLEDDDIAEWIEE